MHFSRIDSAGRAGRDAEQLQFEGDSSQQNRGQMPRDSSGHAEQGTLNAPSSTENKLAKLSPTTFLALWEQLEDCKTKGTFN